MKTAARLAFAVVLLGTLASVQSTAQQAELDPVEIVRFQHEGRTITGTLISKTDATVVVRTLDGDRQTYASGSIQEMQKLSLSRSMFLELKADRLYDEIDASEPAEAVKKLLNVRHLYRRAMLEVEDEDEDRHSKLEDKLELVAEERETLQKAAIQQEQLRREELETKLVETEKRLAEKKIETIEAQQATIERLKRVVNDLNDRDEKIAEFVQDLAEAVEDLDDDLEDLADDVEDLEDRSRIYITRGIFDDLHDDYGDLQGQVNRLEKLVRDLQQQRK
jgi:chromosome segregation ATPase